MLSGSLTDCYDELGNRYQLPAYVLTFPVNLIADDNGDSDADGGDAEADSSQGTVVMLKLRLSNLSKDIKVVVKSTDTVYKVKQLLQDSKGIRSDCQRWFFGGKLLNDKLHIQDAHIPKGFVVQVIVNEAS